MKIIELLKEDISKAVELILEVFMMYEVPGYSREGVETFIGSVRNDEWIGSLKFYGAYREEELVGVIATRNSGDHIALFFVKGEYHNKGIGRVLFNEVVNNSTGDSITVNSSPYAVEIYKHLGFSKVQEEQLTDGMRYTPMVFRINNGEPYHK